MKFSHEFDDELVTNPETVSQSIDGTSEWAALAQVFTAARSEAHSHELASETLILTEMISAFQGQLRAPGLGWGTRFHLQLSKSKMAAAIASSALLATTGMAYADVLPKPVQQVAANTLQTVGLKVPDPHEQEQEKQAEAEKQEQIKNNSKPDNHGLEVSGVAHDTEPGDDHGQTVSGVARDGHGDGINQSGHSTKTTEAEHHDENKNSGEHSTATTEVRHESDGSQTSTTSHSEDGGGSGSGEHESTTVPSGGGHDDTVPH